MKKEISIGEIFEEYLPDEYFDLKIEKYDMVKLKEIIFNRLTDQERNIILYYAETRSQRKVANALNVSVALVNLYIKKIRKKILEYYDD